VPRGCASTPGGSELNVKALLLFLTHTGRALAERHGTLTCYRLVLEPPLSAE